MFDNFRLRMRASQQALLYWLLALERSHAWSAYLVAGMLRPVGLLPALPLSRSANQASVADVLLGALVLGACLWYAAGPVLSAMQPVLVALGTWSSGLMWSSFAGLFLAWRMRAGARYLDRIRLTMVPNAWEARL